MGWLACALSIKGCVLETATPILAEHFLQTTKFDKSSEAPRTYIVKTYDDIQEIIKGLDMS